MFTRLGTAIDRGWWAILLFWVVVLIVVRSLAPPLHEVAEEGELKFLPDYVPSRQGEQLFHEAFPDELGESSLVIIARRAKRPLLPADFEYITETATPALRRTVGLPPRQPAQGRRRRAKQQSTHPLVVRLRSFADQPEGALLTSRDGHATLIVIDLSSEFLSRKNKALVTDVERVLEELEQDDDRPKNFELHLTGSAAIGRDMLSERDDSTKAVHTWTLILVVGLLLTVYRAPLAVLIPLATVACAVHVAMKLLAIAAGQQWLSIFQGIELYVTVICYGAGVDYSLFLISRYQEELERPEAEAAKNPGAHGSPIVRTMQSVGTAIVASAATEIVGIGMLAFAHFQKFHQAGLAIPVGLTVVMFAALTLTPAILRLTGRGTFWPWAPIPVRPSRNPAPFVGTKKDSKQLSRNAWNWIAALVRRRPAMVWLIGVGLMLPFAILAVYQYNRLSYALVERLPDHLPSMRGVAVMKEHFPAGMIGTTTMLLESEETDFSSRRGIRQVQLLASRLSERSEILHLADLRSVSHPLGMLENGQPRLPEGLTSVNKHLVWAMNRGFAQLLSRSRGRLMDAVRARSAMNGPIEQLITLAVAQQMTGRFAADLQESFESQADSIIRGAQTRIVQRGGVRHYVSPTAETAGRVTRIDLLMDVDPFSREAMDAIEELDQQVQSLLPADLYGSTKVRLLGPTASLRDLRVVSQRDQIVVKPLIAAAVLFVLIVLLRKVLISVYLVITVLFSYLVTIGVTWLVFRVAVGPEFPGLDWLVPLFLFSVLVAVGEDYNVFLVTRVEEEQKRIGPVRGIVSALVLTGSIISSCGLIMAGTFSSLLIAGGLASTMQLGFALAFGVLLDTFLVRPIIVPAFLVLLYDGRLKITPKV